MKVSDFCELTTFPRFVEGFYSNFGKAGNDIADTFGLPYDFESLMHYPSNAFAKTNKNVTIISKVSSFLTGIPK